MSRYLLNSAVITAPGLYVYRIITPEEARRWFALEPEPVSTIGYEQTAVALSELLKANIPVRRQTIVMQENDEALVFRLTFPPGSLRIDPQDKGALEAHVLAKNYELGLLTRLSQRRNS